MSELEKEVTIRIDGSNTIRASLIIQAEDRFKLPEKGSMNSGHKQIPSEAQRIGRIREQIIRKTVELVFAHCVENVTANGYFTAFALPKDFIICHPDMAVHLQSERR